MDRALDQPLNLSFSLGSQHSYSLRIVDSWKKNSWSVRSLTISGGDLALDHAVNLESLEHLSLGPYLSNGQISSILRVVSLAKPSLKTLELRVGDPPFFEDTNLLQYTIWEDLLSLTVDISKTQQGHMAWPALNPVLKRCKQLQSLTMVEYPIHAIDKGELVLSKLHTIRLIKVLVAGPRSVKLYHTCFPELTRLSLLQTLAIPSQPADPSSIWRNLTHLELGPELDMDESISFPYLTHLELHSILFSNLRLISAPKLESLSIYQLMYRQDQYPDPTMNQRDGLHLFQLFNEETILGPLLNLRHLTLYHLFLAEFPFSVLRCCKRLEIIRFHTAVLPRSMCSAFSKAGEEILPQLQEMSFDEQCLAPSLAHTGDIWSTPPETLPAFLKEVFKEVEVCRPNLQLYQTKALNINNLRSRI